MNEYQIVPYTFAVHVVGKPGELRNLDDFDAAGTSIVEFIAQAARAHAGDPRLEDKTATTAMRIEQVARSERVVALTVGSGQSGIQAEIVQQRQGSTQTTRVLEHDWTHITVRNVFVVPPGSTKGIALIERVGQTGVVTKLKKMLAATLRARYHDLTFDMMPAMSAEAIEAWAENSRVKSIVLRHTHTGNRRVEHEDRWLTVRTDPGVPRPEEPDLVIEDFWRQTGRRNTTSAAD